MSNNQHHSDIGGQYSINNTNNHNDIGGNGFNFSDKNEINNFLND